jgi:hypothetical protein
MTESAHLAHTVDGLAEDRGNVFDAKKWQTTVIVMRGPRLVIVGRRE